MSSYNVTQIVGKTLIAKKSVPLKRIASDSAPTVFTVSPGDTVGVVDSYLMPGNDRSNIYWSFYDDQNKIYYAPHDVGRFDVKELQNQGALTLEQQQQQQAEANMSTADKAFRLIKNIAFLTAGAYIVKSLIDKK